MATPLGITELLEAILLQVDVKTLLLSQAVNRDFQAIIKNSVKLQQKLFFVPVPDTGQESEPNPLLMIDPVPGVHLRNVPVFRGNYTNDLIYIHDQSITFTSFGTNSILSRELPISGSWNRMLLRQPSQEGSRAKGNLCASSRRPARSVLRGVVRHVQRQRRQFMTMTVKLSGDNLDHTQ